MAADIPHMLAAGLARAEAQLKCEQAVHGLDALDEVHLHPILAQGFDNILYSVFREVPYPGQPEKIPKERERQRCDLVITAAGSAGIIDDIHRRKEIQCAAQTLFAPLAQTMTEPDGQLTEPGNAFWLEVKTIGQYHIMEGYAGPNRKYTSAFSVCRADLRKLAAARDIVRAALAIVLFCADETIGQHDLTAFMHTCLDRHLPVQSLRTASIPIANRIGNQSCTIGLIQVQTDLV